MTSQFRGNEGELIRVKEILLQHLHQGCGKPQQRALYWQGGYLAGSQIHIKMVIFHNWALYVQNVNRILNSCKIGIKLKGYDFWSFYVFRVLLPNLCCFFQNFVPPNSPKMYMFKDTIHI